MLQGYVSISGRKIIIITAGALGFNALSHLGKRSAWCDGVLEYSPPSPAPQPHLLHLWPASHDLGGGCFPTVRFLTPEQDLDVRQFHQVVGLNQSILLGFLYNYKIYT